jgi:hypothetical protein
MLPYSNGADSYCAQLPASSIVTPPVSVYFRSPEFGSRLWNSATGRTGVPKTSIDEHRKTFNPEVKIRSA